MQRTLVDKSILSGQTVLLTGYDNVSGEYRRVLVDETGKLQVDVIASVAISGETVKIASGSFVTAKIDTTASSGQFITAALTSGGFTTTALTSGGFITATINTAATSGLYVTAGSTSGNWVRQNPNEISGQVVTIKPADLSGTRVIINSGGYVTAELTSGGFTTTAVMV